METIKKPYISVVIPLYNKEKAVRATLESVLAQTFTDWECIVVDDGSTDKSREVVEQFMIDDLRFKILSQENSGVSTARNRGVQEATGEFVAFLDGDDLWDPTFLEEAVRLIGDFPDAAIYGLGLGKMVKGVKYPADEFVPMNYRGVVHNLWDDYNTMLAWTSSSTICPRELALKTPANVQLTHGEDLDQWLRLMMQGDAVFFNKTLAFYVLDAENRAMYKVPPIEKHIVSVIGYYAEARKKNAQFRKAFDMQMAYFLYEYLFSPYKKEAQRLAEMLDYSQLKRSIHFRMKYPRIYRMYERVK